MDYIADAMKTESLWEAVSLPFIDILIVNQLMEFGFHLSAIDVGLDILMNP